MRCGAFLAAFLASASKVTGHPLCWDATPTDLNQELTYCPEQPSGACCTAQDEADLQDVVAAAGDISTECEELYKEVSRVGSSGVLCVHHSFHFLLPPLILRHDD